MKTSYHDTIRAHHLASIYHEFLQDYIEEVTREDTPEVKQRAYDLFRQEVANNERR